MEHFGTMAPNLMSLTGARIAKFLIPVQWREFVFGRFSTLTFMHTLNIVRHVSQSGPWFSCQVTVVATLYVQCVPLFTEDDNKSWVCMKCSWQNRASVQTLLRKTKIVASIECNIHCSRILAWKDCNYVTMCWAFKTFAMYVAKFLCILSRVWNKHMCM